MKNVHSKLCSLGPWLWQRRKWGIALVAAVLTGIMVFNPTVRFYVYEHTRWRSSLLPRPGDVLQTDRGKAQARYGYEDLSQYNDFSLPMANYTGTTNWLDVATLKSMNTRLSSIYAGAMVEIIDYVEVTWMYKTAGNTVKFTLADCEVIDVLAKRPELCSLEAGDRITVLLYASPRYPPNDQFVHEYIEPYEWEPLYRGERLIHCLAPMEDEGGTFDNFRPWADYYAGIYEYLYRMPVEQGKADFTGFGRYLNIPELFENYGGMVDGCGATEDWTMETFSSALQDYLDTHPYIPYRKRREPQ